MGYVYRILNTSNGKYYVGSTIRFEKRKRTHLNSLRKNKHHSIKLQEDFNYFGEESFVFEVLKECDDYREEEQRLLDTTCKETMYNIGLSAIGGDNISNHPNRDEIVKRLAALVLNCPKPKPRYGSDNGNWRGGISTTSKLCACGNKKTSKAQGCESCYDRSGENNSFFGRCHTNETKSKISLMRQGRYNGNQEIPVSVSDKTFKSVSEAARQLGVVPGTIINRIRSDKFPEYNYKT